MSNELLDTEAVAELLGVKPETVRWYNKDKSNWSRGRGTTLPPADQYFGRSPVWKRETIVRWISERDSVTTHDIGTAPQ